MLCFFILCQIGCRFTIKIVRQFMLFKIGQQVHKVSLFAIVFTLRWGQTECPQHIRQLLIGRNHQLQLRAVLHAVKQEYFNVNPCFFTQIVGEVILIIIRYRSDGWRSDYQFTRFNQRQRARVRLTNPMQNPYRLAMSASEAPRETDLPFSHDVPSFIMSKKFQGFVSLVYNNTIITLLYCQLMFSRNYRKNHGKKG